MYERVRDPPVLFAAGAGVKPESKLVKPIPGKGKDGGAGGAAIRREKATVAGARLFHLKDDVGEQADLSGKHPEKVQELTAAWQTWDAELADPLWGPPVRKKKKN